jgi:hypothetical protein
MGRPSAAARAGSIDVRPEIATPPRESRWARTAPHAGQVVASAAASAEHHGHVRAASIASLIEIASSTGGTSPFYAQPHHASRLSEASGVEGHRGTAPANVGIEPTTAAAAGLSRRTPPEDRIRRLAARHRAYRGRMASRRKPEELARESDQLITESRTLRELSDRLIEEIENLRTLEGRARDLPIGSAEFERVSQEITDRIRGVFRMSALQEALGAEARQQERTINEVPPEDDR